MPWFRHPITRSDVRPDPHVPARVQLRASVRIELERVPGHWVRAPDAVIDTGSAICLFSATWARANGFRLPPSTTLPVRTAGGQVSGRVYEGDTTARFARMPEVPFALATVFSDAHPPGLPALIGLHNILTYWRITFDGTREPGAPAGHMRFETL